MRKCLGRSIPLFACTLHGNNIEGRQRKKGGGDDRRMRKAFACTAISISRSGVGIRA